MPWKTIKPMDQKIALIADCLKQDFSLKDLAQKYKISRKTIHKWLKRYKKSGLEGLKEQRRMPRSCPHKTSEEVFKLILAQKLENRKRGPRKIRQILEVRHPLIQFPATSTIDTWLKKQGLVSPRKKRLRVPPYEQPFKDCLQPNNSWSADYKGQFLMGNKQVCYPLTISDNYSRYLLKCHALPGPRYLETKKVFESAFLEYGLPEAIRTDNGVPFAGKSLGGLSRLSVWWILLGIIPERIKKGCPQQNGRHERMHRTLKAEVLDEVGANLKEQQTDFDWFRTDYNCERPHEALRMQTPSQWYKRSSRPYVEKPLAPDYDASFVTRMVHANGDIKFNSSHFFISEHLANYPVGLKQIAEDQWKIYFSFLLLGVLDTNKNKILRENM
jgi:putative transposase